MVTPILILILILILVSLPPSLLLAGLARKQFGMQPASATGSLAENRQGKLVRESPATN